MANKRQKTQYSSAPAPQKQAKSRDQVHNTILTYYLLLMFSFFTLFLTNQYANSRHDKFYLYLLLSGLLIVGAGVSYGLWWSEHRSAGGCLSSLIKPVSVADGAFLCFVIFAAISAVASRYFPQTIVAEIGRNNGLLLIVFYAMVYFIVTRMYVHKDYVIAVYLIFSCVVALLTVLHFFYIDPLGLLSGYDEKTAQDFGSTIGNKNTIASYMAMFLPIALMTLPLNKKLWMRIISGVSLIFAYAGALCANSGSFFLGLSAALPVMIIFCAQRYDTLKRCMLGLTILFAGGKLLRLFSYFMSDRQKGFEFVQDFLVYDKLSFLPILLCGLIALALYLLEQKLAPRYPAKALTITLLSLSGAAILGIVGSILYFTLIDTGTDLGSFETLLRFNDRWGTHRGFMWIRSMEEYGKFGFGQKLFGAGPDTAYYVLQPHFAELSARFHNSSTNSVHNEYLNYLVTQGALGLISYLTLLGAVCVRTLKRARHNPLALVFLSAVIFYAVQAIVNLYQPITTPLFFLFLSIAESLNRQTPLTKKR